MMQDELITALHKTALMLDDELLNEVTSLLEKNTFLDRDAQLHGEDAETASARIYNEFIAELRAQIRTNDELA